MFLSSNLIFLTTLVCSAAHADLLDHKCNEEILIQVKESDFSLQSPTEKKQLKCISGDYDGDGNKDTAVFKHQPEPGSTGNFKVRVYFSAQGKIKKSIEIDHGFGLPPMNYPKGDNSFEKGCPKSLLVGIFDPGEGGDNHVFIWEKSLTKFKHYTCGSDGGM